MNLEPLRDEYIDPCKTGTVPPDALNQVDTFIQQGSSEGVKVRSTRLKGSNLLRDTGDADLASVIRGGRSASAASAASAPAAPSNPAAWFSSGGNL